MIESAPIDFCSEFINQANEKNISYILPASSQDFPISIKGEIMMSGFSVKQIKKISDEFVSTQKKSLGKIIPKIPDELQAYLIYLPISEPLAFAVEVKGGHVIVITSGIDSLLRTHAINSIFSNRLDIIEENTNKNMEKAHQVVKLMNLYSLLFLSGRLSSLPLTENYVSKDIRDAGWRLAEVSLLFIILHEYGHAYYATQNKKEKKEFFKKIKLHINEDLNNVKREELFADQFAINCLNHELAGPIIHSSLIFFVIRSFIEKAGFSKGNTHPLAINRLHCLLNHTELYVNASKNWTDGILKQISQVNQSNKSLEKIEGGEHITIEVLNELANYAKEKIKSDEWIKIIKEVCSLDKLLNKKS